jgi:6-phosphofructokinase
LRTAIRAVIFRAIDRYGMQVLGIYEGTTGLLERPMQYEELDLGIVTSSLLRLDGTILGTVNKGNPGARGSSRQAARCGTT